MANDKVWFDPLTPVNFLLRSAAVYPDQEAVVYNDLRFTYAQFYQRVNRLADALKKCGVGPGDKVAFLCPNTPPMLEAHFAVPMIGAVLVAINFRLSPREISYIVNHSGSKVLVADNEFSPPLAELMNEMPLLETLVNICDIDQARPLEGLEYEEFLAAGSPGPMACRVEDEHQVVSINYTSGTTGFPKGVMYHHRGAYSNALNDVIEVGLDVRSTYLWTLPMFHCNGWCFTWAVTAAGGTNVCLRQVVPEEIFRLIEAENVSHLCAAPTVLVGMSTFPGTANLKLKRVLKIMTGGAPPPPAVIENMEAIGAEVTHLYGLTETYGPHLICSWQPAWDHKSGREIAKMKARQGVANLGAMHADVVDPDTMIPVPRDGQAIGEIVMRGNNVMLGYYNDQEATAKAFKGGWFHSGDLAVVHPDGYVQIVDRKKDIIISGGENISTVEVENVIYSHPDVLEAAVIPIPHEKWGEVPKAFVSPKEGKNLTAEDIIAHCRANLAHFKAPKEVEFCDLPKTATGKIQKFKLRDKEWAGRDRMPG